jgi:hypothetical protein
MSEVGAVNWRCRARSARIPHLAGSRGSDTLRVCACSGSTQHENVPAAVSFVTVESYAEIAETPAPEIATAPQGGRLPDNRVPEGSPNPSSARRMIVRNIQHSIEPGQA